MSRIADAFASAKAAGRPAYIPFLTAGDPSPAHTPPLCEALARSGAGIIELGVPFSDPLADGPIIQRASQRALSHGVGLARSLELAAEVRRRIGAALVLFTYYNPILRMGEEAFAARAQRSGVDGVLVSDLPLEEGRKLRTCLIARGIDPILMAAPTSGVQRIAMAAAQARGFIYYISRTGVTGTQEALPAGLMAEIAAVRRAASLPVAVGFGISSPEQVAAAGSAADGVVVGSALVLVVEESVISSNSLGASGGAAPDLEARLEAAARRLFGT